MSADLEKGHTGEPYIGQPYTLAITGSGLYGGYLCLQYALTPVPAELVQDRSLHEYANAGIALDAKRHVYRDCRGAYRTSGSGTNVLGALKIGPADWAGLGRVRVLFAPLARTPGVFRTLCEVQVIIDATRVRSATIRRA
jgi:hypothetical protein